MLPRPHPLFFSLSFLRLIKCDSSNSSRVMMDLAAEQTNDTRRNKSSCLFYSYVVATNLESN